MIEIKSLSISVGDVSLISNSNFNVSGGEIVGLFGESGVGKSVFSLFLLGLLSPDVFSVSASSARFKVPGCSFDFLTKRRRDWCSFRSRFVSLVFQDPSTSLNPSITCGKQIKEALLFKKEKKTCINLLKEVEIVDPEKTYNSFPHELSGGQKQRVVIAIALASNPSFLIADEPTTALDPSVQRSVLNLFTRLIKTRKISIILISHNLDLIMHYSNKVYLFQGGIFLDSSSVYFKKRFDFLFKLLKRIKKRNRPVLKKLNLNRSVFDYSLLGKKPLFKLKNISVCFKKNDLTFSALKNINISLSGGDCLGVVGGSGSGKTTLGRVLCGLEKNYSGDFCFPDSGDFLTKNVQMVYQDPFYSFNPKYTVGDSVLEIINTYKSSYSVEDLFNIVSLDPVFINSFPHELSGGQNQRVSIARVLASNPSVIVFDESISALDIEVQFSILETIRFINKKLSISVVFISHDINSVYYLCNNIVVLKTGSVVDFFKTKDLFSPSRNNYTKLLVSDSIFN